MTFPRLSLRTLPLALIALAAASSVASAQQAPLTFHDDAPPAAAGNPVAPPPAYGQPPQSSAPTTPLVPGAPVTPGALAPPTSMAPLAGVPAAAPGQQPGAVPGQPGVAVQPPAPPFVLNKLQLDYVKQTLQMWETESAKVDTFNANFDRLEYDSVWGSGNRPLIVSTGLLSYSKPDKGSFKIDAIKRWTKTDPKNESPDAPGDFVEQKEEIGEHWVCDGKAVYEYDHRSKQLVVTPIPPAMRGKAIVDGPLPFLFGAEANKLMERYWIRVKQSNQVQIWLEAYPRRAADSLNYDSVDVMLDRKTMQPNAIQVHLPGGQQRHVYAFQPPTINGKLEVWWGGLFSSPRTPLGWKRVVIEDQVPADAQGQPQSQQAANPAGPVQR